MALITGLTTVAMTQRAVEGRRLAVLTIDNPPVNAAARQVRADLLHAFRALEEAAGLAGVVLSGANGNFVAGADIREFDKPPAEPHLADVVAAIEACRLPVVAAIDGAALGGGYELALGCDFRLATERSIVGLPEVTLGLIPGAGGTVRLPRLVGVATAIGLISTGRRVPAGEARGLGMIDGIVAGDVVGAACELLARSAIGKNVVLERPVIPSPPGETEAAGTAARKQARGSQAVLASIDAVGRAASQPAGEALRHERETSLRLRRGEQSQALRHLFLAERAAARAPENARPLAIATAGVVGAGQMGRGIAVALASAGYRVCITDSDRHALEAVGAHLRKLAQSMERSGRAVSANDLLARISVCDLDAFGACDLVVEAIVEDMHAKQALFEALDAIVRPDALLASNTSYLDIDALAGRTSRPARVAGMHFFNPANVMRLVEIIRGEASAPETLATLMAVCKKLGKVGVPARVGEGFIGNRIFSAYRRQCEFLLEEGSCPEDVDRAMQDFGMAMGPFAVFDLAGLDIAWATRRRLAPGRDPAERYVAIADRLCEAGRFGRKAGKGWYLYSDDGRPLPDPVVRGLIEEASREKGLERRAFPAEEIRSRLLAAMINEACLVLAGGIAERSSDVDLVLVHGYGFPKLKGGPLFWASRRPRPEVIAMIDDMVGVSGPTARRAPNIDEVLDGL